MKNSFIVTIILGMLMLTVPLSSLNASGGSVKSVSTELSDVLDDSPPAPAAYKSFKIKITENGKTEEINAEEYLIGVLSGEVPASYTSEALKAQAVAAYTFACYKKAKSTDDFDLTDNPQIDQCYIPEQKANEKWGEKSEEYRNKIRDAVKSVYGMILTYDGAIALSCYHAISSGKTESCKDVWGSDLPYLISVDSVGDRLAENYLSSKQFTTEEVSEKLSGFKTAEGEPANWFSSPDVSSTGRVKTINFCGATISGSEIAATLNLRSANFEVKHTESGFEFTTKGYGHGVGMSQNGAEYMALQGSNFKEILAHYYPNCKLVKAEL